MPSLYLEYQEENTPANEDNGEENQEFLYSFAPQMLYRNPIENSMEIVVPQEIFELNKAVVVFVLHCEEERQSNVKIDVAKICKTRRDALRVATELEIKGIVDENIEWKNDVIQEVFVFPLDIED